ncbi:Calmodulin-regulated spectrin-associated protein 3 [Orchesella cincta]|uniref:Calmodulin-regulated spectrin-associated protein 3 n=1 Tax=Orchesella cincta TaxID=48709 RepID=A0A1D2MZI6_ORCCI|nr:Calmodulin-regulated spectrin-associated protein 3 [Orchesella cincta]
MEASNKVNRWLNLPDVGEIRDLCDGVGICALFALYCSNDLKVEEISVPEPGDTLTIYDSITNHSLVQKLCDDLFPEPIYHLCVTDFLYIHGCMKQNILCFLVDLFVHLEINPILRVNRLTHVPIRVEL